MIESFYRIIRTPDRRYIVQQRNPKDRVGWSAVRMKRRRAFRSLWGAKRALHTYKKEEFALPLGDIIVHEEARWKFKKL